MLKQQIYKTLQYFQFFNYAPTFEELHIFLQARIPASKLEKVLSSLIKQKKINFKDGRYTVGEYSISKSKIKNQKSKVKIESVKTFVKLLSWFPQIKLIGLSGSVAMMNAEEDDDIDIFIVSAAKRIWTARVIALTVAQLLGRRRKFVDNFTKDKICLNMFFDESNMQISKKKRSEYVAHEVLQMKPLFIRQDTYLRYLDANKWVYDIFPNAHFVIARNDNDEAISLYSQTMRSHLLTASVNHAEFTLLSARDDNFIAGKIEMLLKKIQMHFINKHKTSEIITDTQLWFFPEDFEKKLKL